MNGFFEDSDKIVLSREGQKVTLARPGSYYRGTRFDWNGVFYRVECGGAVYCDKWFDNEDPFKHDNLCGPSEEFFGCYGYDSAGIGEGFLKVGVGLLKKDSDGPYDWFHTYQILDSGRMEVQVEPHKAVFSQELPGFYKYLKTVELTGPDTFSIFHSLTVECQMQIRQYCHNFFTFGLDSVGTERSVEFNSPIGGMQRKYVDKIAYDSRRIWITDKILPGEKCYLDNIRTSSPDGYGFLLKAGNRSVRVDSTLPMATSVLWSNDRVFCPEPYVDLNCVSRVPVEWTNRYRLL